MQGSSSNLIRNDVSRDQPTDGMSTSCRYATKAITLIGSIVAMVLGVWCIVTGILSPLCIVAGIWQLLVGSCLIAIEAPWCCPCLPAQTLSNCFDGKPVWRKSLLYLILSIPPIIMCFDSTTVFGSGFIFVCSAIYGTQLFGKIASREDMAAAARAGGR